MQPHLEIIQPALTIANQVRVAAVGLIILALIVSVVMARWISHPVVQLSQSARQIEASVDAIDISLTDAGSAAGQESHGASLSPAISMPRIRGTREIANLVTVFGQMVNALYKRINELGSTYVLGQTITATIDYEQTLNTVLEAMQRALGADAADISVVRQQEQVVAAWRGSPGLEDLQDRAAPLAQGLRGQVLQSKAMLWIPSPEQIPAGLEASAAAELTRRGIYSFLGAPLVNGEKLIGAIALENHRPSSFSEDNRRQLQRLAVLASIAIDNAFQVRQREQALKEQIRELKIEIDEVKKARQVEEIVESEFFNKLQDQAARFRSRARAKGTPPEQ